MTIPKQRIIILIKIGEINKPNFIKKQGECRVMKKQTISEKQIVFSIQELKEAGFSHYKINQMVDEGHLRKLNKKFYENLRYQGKKSPLYYIGAYTPEGVVCLRSAAAYYRLTDSEPDAIDVAIPRKARISTIPEYPPLAVSYYADNRYETGITTVREGSNCFRIYDKEKTVLDVVSSQDKVGMEEAGNIVAGYLKQKDRNLDRLMRYARLLKCADSMQSFLDVYGEKERGRKVVELVDVCRQYGEGAGRVDALNHVNVRINKGEFVAVVGASGSGKSTLLNVCGGLDTPTSGDVYIEGTDLGGLSDDELTEFRRKRIGFVFQNYNLVPVMSVYENIVLPVQIGGHLEDKVLLKRIMDSLGLSGLENRLPSELSGGQQQRVAIARALICAPAIILADEPTGNLDSASTEDVMGLLRCAVRDFGQTVIMITHNETLTKACDRILRMKDGRLTEDNPGDAAKERKAVVEEDVSGGKEHA